MADIWWLWVLPLPIWRMEAQVPLEAYMSCPFVTSGLQAGYEKDANCWGFGARFANILW